MAGDEVLALDSRASAMRAAAAGYRRRRRLNVVAATVITRAVDCLSRASMLARTPMVKDCRAVDGRYQISTTRCADTSAGGHLIREVMNGVEASSWIRPMADI